jgi:hypothetical protein
VEESSAGAGGPGPEGAGGASGAAGGPQGPESEEELRQRIEEGLRTVRVQDVVLESVVTMVNLTARRIGKEDERDLEQARVGIDAIRSLVELLEPEPQTQVRNALSELQMLYARHAGGEGGAEPGAGAGGEPPSEGGRPGGGGAPEPGPETPPGGVGAGGERKPPPGLWVPPGSS